MKEEERNEVADHVEMIELNIEGFKINPTLLWDDEMAILVDTGMPGQLSAIKAAMQQVGVPFEKLKASHFDHTRILIILAVFQKSFRNHKGN